MPSDTQVIYSMTKVGRIAQSAPNKQVLRDPQASLGFYYGATCGRRARTRKLACAALGKSTLLRIEG